MRDYKLHIVALLGLMVLSGCTGSDASPRSGTQAGAATGAIAGSIIGYHSGSDRHKGRNAIAGGLIGAVAGGTLGAAIDEGNRQPAQTGGWQ